MDTLPTLTKAPPEEAQRLRMTYEEYLAWADEDVHAEWINGEVIVHMPPKERHQVTGTCEVLATWTVTGGRPALC